MSHEAAAEKILWVSLDRTEDQARGPFLEGPETFSHLKSHSNISLEAYDYRAVLLTYS